LVSILSGGSCTLLAFDSDSSTLRPLNAVTDFFLSTVENGSKILAAASTAEVEVRKEIGASGKGGNVAAAQAIGKRIAEKAKAAGVEKVAFDRAGFAYHGRVKALAEAAREAGLQF